MFPRLFRLTLGLLGGVLAVFHGWLFVAQAAAGRLEDPWLIFRWVASASLVAGLVVLRRSGASVWGQKGIAIWVLAALLHAPSVAGRNDFAALALPETVATSVVQLLSSAAVALGIWLLAFLRRRISLPAFYSYVAAFSPAGQPSAADTPQFSPRPPPLRS